MNDDTQQPESETPEATHSMSLSRIVRNSTFNAVGMGVIIPLNFIGLFTMAQRLGAEPMGIYFTLFAISAVIHWISDAGTSTVLTRRLARAPERLRPIVAESMGIMLVVCSVTTVLFMLVSVPWMSFELGHTPWMLLIVAAAAMVARHMIDFASNTFRGIERFEFENLARVIQSASFCLFVWFYVFDGPHATLAAYIAFTASNVLAAVFVWGVLLVGWCCPMPHLNRSIVRNWYTESMPLGVGDVVRQLYLQLDTLLLSLLSTPVAVGLFSVASRPLQPLRLVPRTIVSVTFPMMSRAAHLDRASLSNMFAKTTNLLWIASLPICIATATCAEPLVLKTAGPNFEGAINPLRVLIWATVLTFTNAQLRFAFTALDAERKFWRLSIGSLLVKLPLVVALIVPFGIYGACIGVFVGEMVVTAWGIFSLKSLDVHPPSWVQLARALPAGLAMYGTLQAFVQPDSGLLWIAVGSVVSGVVYLLACLLTGAWPRADAQMFRRALRSSFGGAQPGLAPSRGS